MMKKYLTLEQAAELIHMPLETFRKKIRAEVLAERIKVYKPGKTVLIDERELELFIKRSQVAS